MTGRLICMFRDVFVLTFHLQVRSKMKPPVLHLLQVSLARTDCTLCRVSELLDYRCIARRFGADMQVVDHHCSDERNDFGFGAARRDA